MRGSVSEGVRNVSYGQSLSLSPISSSSNVPGERTDGVFL
jgi:hypothetical protein